MPMSIFIPIIIILTAILILHGVWRDAGEIHSALKAFKTRAIIAKDNSELRDIETSLRLYIEKRCWHKHHLSHACEVLSYIHGRLNVVHLQQGIKTKEYLL